MAAHGGQGSDDEYFSLDIDDKASIVAEIRAQQNELNIIRNQCEEEVDKVEEKFEQLKKPYYEKRSKLIQKIPHFWLKVFKAHPEISELITPDDEYYLEYLFNVQVNDVPTGFQIHLYFYQNPIFENNLLTKEIRTDGSSSCTPIKWKSGSRVECAEGQQNFVKWFTNPGLEEIDDFDVVSFAIKDEVWGNPLRFYVDEITVDSEEDGATNS